MAVAADGDDVRMLEEQELVGDQSLFAASGELLLELERAGVVDAPELAQRAAPVVQSGIDG